MENKQLLEIIKNLPKNAEVRINSSYSMIYNDDINYIIAITDKDEIIEVVFAASLESVFSDYLDNDWTIEELLESIKVLYGDENEVLSVLKSTQE